MGGSKEVMAQTLRFLPESTSISSDDIDLDTLCSVMDIVASLTEQIDANNEVGGSSYGESQTEDNEDVNNPRLSISNQWGSQNHR